MKKLVLCVCCIFPILSSAQTFSPQSKAFYQELCAKEHDPVKRQNYCLLLQDNSANSLLKAFSKETAIV